MRKPSWLATESLEETASAKGNAAGDVVQEGDTDVVAVDTASNAEGGDGDTLADATGTSAGDVELPNTDTAISGNADTTVIEGDVVDDTALPAMGSTTDTDVALPPVSSMGDVTTDTDGDTAVAAAQAGDKGATGGDFIEGGEDVDPNTTDLVTILKPFDGEAIAVSDTLDSTEAVELDVMAADADMTTLDTDAGDLEDDTAALESIAIVAMESLRTGGMSPIAIATANEQIQRLSSRWGVKGASVATESLDELSPMAATRMLADTANVACEGLLSKSAGWLTAKISSFGEWVGALASMSKGLTKDVARFEARLAKSSDHPSVKLMPTALWMQMSYCGNIDIVAANKHIAGLASGMCTISDLENATDGLPPKFDTVAINRAIEDVLPLAWAHANHPNLKTIPGSIIINFQPKGKNGDNPETYNKYTSIAWDSASASKYISSIGEVSLDGKIIAEMIKTITSIATVLERSRGQYVKDSAFIKGYREKINKASDEGDVDTTKKLSADLNRMITLQRAIYASTKDIAAGYKAIITDYLRTLDSEAK